MKPLPFQPQEPTEIKPPPPLLTLSEGDHLLWAALSELSLNIAQTAALCGLSVRQLSYWTKQGYISAAGNGTRRIYGPEAIKRILSIRYSMRAGKSLRQALRSLENVMMSDNASSAPSYAADGTALAPPFTEEHISSQDTEAIAADLRSLFAQNRHVRDSAAGLSAKVARQEAGVRQAADQLTALGVLTKSSAEKIVVYAAADRSMV